MKKVLLLFLLSLLVSAPCRVEAMFEIGRSDEKEKGGDLYNDPHARTEVTTKKNQEEALQNEFNYLSSNTKVKETGYFSAESQEGEGKDDSSISSPNQVLSEPLEEKNLFDLSVLQQEQEEADNFFLNSQCNSENELNNEDVFSLDYWKRKRVQYKQAFKQASEQGLSEELLKALKKLCTDSKKIIKLLEPLEQKNAFLKTKRAGNDSPRATSSRHLKNEEHSKLEYSPATFTQEGASFVANTVKEMEHWNPRWPISHTAAHYYTKEEEVPLGFWDTFSKVRNRTGEQREAYRDAIRHIAKQMPVQDQEDFKRRFYIRELLGQPLTPDAIKEWRDNRERNVETSIMSGMFTDGIRGALKIFSLESAPNTEYLTIPESYPRSMASSQIEDSPYYHSSESYKETTMSGHTGPLSSFHLMKTEVSQEPVSHMEQSTDFYTTLKNTLTVLKNDAWNVLINPAPVSPPIPSQHGYTALKEEEENPDETFFFRYLRTGIPNGYYPNLHLKKESQQEKGSSDYSSLIEDDEEENEK